LQALTLLNDPAFFEIAERLAARILNERPNPVSDRERLHYTFLLCLGRPASTRELEALEKVLARERALCDSSQTKSAGLQAKPPGKGALAPAAPWVTVARVLLNLDEYVTRE
jgi:hypothetical protein